jgi:hypothetical protein
MQYYWCSIIFFSFPSFPKFHREVPLLRTCSRPGFVYDHACFCIYVYVWICLPCMRETCGFCVSDSGLLHLTWCPPIANIYLQITCHYSLWHCVYICIYIYILCIYICHSFLVHSSIVGHLGCFQSLVIVNGAAMNIGVSFLYCILSYVPLRRCPGQISLHHISTPTVCIHWDTPLNISLNINNKSKDCKIGTVCVGEYVGGYLGEEGEERRLRWCYMIDELHKPIWNRTKKPLAIALDEVGRELRGRDDGDNINNVQ